MPTNIPILPTLHWGKRKERSTMHKVWTPDGRIIYAETPVTLNCSVDEKRQAAYLISGENQLYSTENKCWTQGVNEIDSIPLQFIEQSFYDEKKLDAASEIEKEKKIKEIGDQLFILTSEKAQAEVYEWAKQNEGWERLKWILTLVFGPLVVIAFFAFVRG